MDLRIKQVWLPGAASFLLFLGWYFMLGAVPAHEILTIPYLVVMPFVGALGAYLSRRMQGSAPERMLSALFPVFTFVALFAWRVVFGLFFEGVPYDLPHFLAGLSLMLKFTVVGGLLLVLGALPFCRPNRREPSP
jgi:hypothetical protein